ncbi:MAG: NAD(P)H-hydrate epimerase [Actinomycetota bacterium]|nr:NAD(P)H-hydrate epimerase [Actinomycetota bacterium]
MRTVPAAAVPAVTAEQMREVDRVATQELQIGLIQMMENAGRSLADLAISVFRPESVTVLAGRGGNGGGGLVAARHLANRGVTPRVVLSRPDAELADVPAHQLEIARRIGVEVGAEPPAAGLVIDALIGYSLRGDPRGRSAELIAWANQQQSPVLALDLPSGLDATIGRPATPCIHAAATLALGLPKAGLSKAPELTGRLYLADISVPPAVYRRLGIRAPLVFEHDTILELTWSNSHSPSAGQ